MPIIYLSPSTQENNLLCQRRHRGVLHEPLADNMVPYLNASGIRYSRTPPT